MYIFAKNTNKISKIGDFRNKKEKKVLSYNDGTISIGKLWVGFSDKKENKKIGHFGYFEKKEFIKIDKNFKVSNGPAIDEKRKSIYFSDSATRTIFKYSFNKFKRKVFFKFHSTEGYPDGIALDNKGGLWVAHWAGGKVSRINKSGNIDFSINLPALNITSVTFVGKKLDHIFVTSAKVETTIGEKKKYSHCGSSFLFKTNFIGQSIPYVSPKTLKLFLHLQK